MISIPPEPMVLYVWALRGKKPTVEQAALHSGYKDLRSGQYLSGFDLLGEFSRRLDREKDSKLLNNIDAVRAAARKMVPQLNCIKCGRPAQLLWVPTDRYTSSGSIVSSAPSLLFCEKCQDSQGDHIPLSFGYVGFFKNPVERKLFIDVLVHCFEGREVGRDERTSKWAFEFFHAKLECEREKRPEEETGKIPVKTVFVQTELFG